MPADVTGRFAPSPTGELHLGNLRTALVAWLSARSVGGRFIVRMEDLDRVTSSTAHAERQLTDLSAIGIDWDGEVLFQSERFDLYRDALARLTEGGLTYPCFCTRREIREAAAAPHGDAGGRYPGTCRNLSEAERQRRAGDRPPAIRLRAEGTSYVVHDRVAGDYAGVADDVVLQRNDGVPAYNLAVVVDDAQQGVTEVVRGDDLLPSTPSQIHLQRLLGLPTPAYVHVPLALGPDGDRLAKRHGSVTLSAFTDPADVLSMLARSLALAAPGEHVTAADLLSSFTMATLPRTPWLVPLS